MGSSRLYRAILSGLALYGAAAVPVGAGDWPAFRGPTGNGISGEAKAPLFWGPQKNVRWKAELPGPGNSSPIVSRGRVFVTCAEDNGLRRNLYCFDRENGERRWMTTVEVPLVEPTHRSNPYCASTPVADGERVVVWHGSAGVYCYDFEGHQVWHRELGEMWHEWGYASSPMLAEGKVFLNFGPGDRTFVAALDLRTGSLLWKTDEPDGCSITDKKMVGSWSSPVVIQVENKTRILVSMPTRVVAYDPDTGTIVWQCGGLGGGRADLVYASPVVWNRIGVAFTGYVQGPTMAFRLDGSGDVTTTQRMWRSLQSQRIGSGVVVDGFLYVANAGPATAECIECLTGKSRWSARIEGGEPWGSVVMAAGRLYVTSRRGVTTVFRPDPDKFDMLAHNELGEPSNSTPAISDGEIFLRTDAHVFCIRED